MLPELVSYLEGLAEPHILFDRQYRILAANAAYRRQFSPTGSVIGRTCYEVSHHFSVPCDQAGESCPLARSRESGQRERVLHLHHTPQGESYVNIELVPLRDASGDQACFIETRNKQFDTVGVVSLYLKRSEWQCVAIQTSSTCRWAEAIRAASRLGRTR